MKREVYLKQLIKENGFKLKDFAKYIDMPYTTLLTILNNERIGYASIDNAIKICKGLHITVQELQAVEEEGIFPDKKLILSEHEERILLAYRKKTDLQRAINILLFSEEN